VNIVVDFINKGNIYMNIIVIYADNDNCIKGEYFWKQEASSDRTSSNGNGGNNNQCLVATSKSVMGKETTAAQ